MGHGREEVRVEREYEGDRKREELRTVCRKIRNARLKLKRCSSVPALLYNQGW